MSGATFWRVPLGPCPAPLVGPCPAPVFGGVYKAHTRGRDRLRRHFLEGPPGPCPAPLFGPCPAPLFGSFYKAHTRGRDRVRRHFLKSPPRTVSGATFWTGPHKRPGPCPAPLFGGFPQDRVRRQFLEAFIRLTQEAGTVSGATFWRVPPGPCPAPLFGPCPAFGGSYKAHTRGRDRVRRHFLEGSPRTVSEWWFGVGSWPIPGVTHFQDVASTTNHMARCGLH